MINLDLLDHFNRGYILIFGRGEKKPDISSNAGRRSSIMKKRAVVELTFLQVGELADITIIASDSGRVVRFSS